MDEISLVLQGIYAPQPILEPPSASVNPQTPTAKAGPDVPFALVDGVAPQSPAAQAVSYLDALI